MGINKISILVFLCFSLLSCKNKDSDDNWRQEQIKSLVKEYTGKTFILPEGLPIYNKREGESFSKDKPSIVFVVNGNCNSCVGILGSWDKFLQLNPSIYDQVNIIGYISGSDYGLFEQMSKDVKFSFEYFYDAQGLFAEKNKIADDPFVNTFLLDKNNNVLLVGCPLGNQKLTGLYQEQVRKINKS